MRSSIKFFIFAVFVIQYQVAWARDNFKLVSDNHQIQMLADEIAFHLPNRLKQVINQKITITFKALDQNSDIYFGCERELKSGAKSVAASLGLPTHPKNEKEINIHIHFLKKLINAPDAIACGQSIRLHFARAVTHELMHIFEASVPPGQLESEYAKRYCRPPSKSGKGVAKAPSALCKNIQRKWKLSSSARFLNLDNWFSPNKTKNTLRRNSIDPYIFSKAREAFAVQAEAFLYDSEFSCRKPAMYRYFSDILQIMPFNGVCSNPNTVIYSRNQKIDLDPSRFYQAHYLYASKGEEISSRWGHSMLRLVFCAPERQVMNDKCLEDVSYHYVVSFRANIEDFELDNIKGLTGKYPSQMFILNLNEVVREYTQVELRDLKSLPLNLSFNEKLSLIEKVRETYWTYRGKYYFLSNNCADETFSLLAGVLGEKFEFSMQKFMFLDSALVKPGELYSYFQDIQLAAQMTSNNEEQVAKGYLFLSARDKIELAYSLIAKSHGLSLDRYIKMTTARDRLRNFESMVVQDPDAQVKLASANYVIESHVLIRKQSELRKLIAKILSANNQELLNLYGKTRAQYDDTIENRILNIKRDSYGVPLFNSDIMRRDTNITEFPLDLTIILEVEKFYPGEAAELQSIEKNLKLFIKKTIKPKPYNSIKGEL